MRRPLRVLRSLRRTWYYWAITLSFLLYLVVVWVLPPRLISSFDIKEDKDKAVLENDYRKTIASVLGGTLAVATAILTWRELVDERDKSINDQLNNAVGRLGSEDKTMQADALSALRKVAADSPEKEYWRAITAISSHIRNRSPWDGSSDPERISDDIAHAIKILCGREEQNDPVGQVISLKRTNLYNATFTHTSLRGADFSGSYLRDVLFDEVDLTDAVFSRSKLRDVVFRNCTVSRSEFDYAIVDIVTLERCKHSQTISYQGVPLDAFNFFDCPRPIH